VSGWVFADEIPARFGLAGVEFRGVTSVSKKALGKTLAARMPPAWKIWQPGPILVKADVEDDLARIRQFYQSEGYYRAAVVASAKVAGDRPEAEGAAQEAAEETGKGTGASLVLPLVEVTFSVTEGQPVRVASVDLDITPSVARAISAEVEDRLPLRPDDVFRTADYEATKDNIARTLGTRGYPFSRVSGQAVVDPKTHQARLSFGVDPGPPAEFGPVTIEQEGEAVSEKVLRRALAFKAGEPYDIAKVEASRRNLIGLDIFRTTVLQPQKPSAPDGGEVPMHVRLKAKEPRSVRFGVGYGTEDKLRLQAALTYRNLFAQGGRLTLSGRGSALLRKVQLAYTQPYFWDARNTLTLSAGNEIEEPPAYKNRKIFSDVTLNRTLDHHLFVRLGYRLSFNKEQSSAADPGLGIEVEQFLNESVRISAVDVEIGRDTRDDLLNPTRGSYLGAAITYAPEYLGSEMAYYQPAITARAYHKVYKEVVLAGQVNLQTIQGIQGTDFIPSFKRLYLGGSSTVRGYDFQKLPPLDSNAQPIGGQTGFHASLETRFPIYQALSGVLFVDAGLLDTEPFALDFSQTRYTCGAGLRYNTVVGPIRLDFGYKLNPQTGKDIGDTANPDKAVDGLWRIYFNIGQAF